MYFWRTLFGKVAFTVAHNFNALLGDFVLKRHFLILIRKNKSVFQIKKKKKIGIDDSMFLYITCCILLKCPRYKYDLNENSQAQL